jgi:hypothetical protein
MTTTTPTTNDVLAMANLIYGEAGGEGEDFMKMVGSSVMQRAMVGREFGSTIQDVVNNPKSGYYAVQKNSPMYQQAVSQSFPDEQSQMQYKRAVQIASGLVSGDIGFGNTQFYFTDKEIKKLKKNPSAFDFNKVDEIGAIQGTKEKFKLYRYK